MAGRGGRTLDKELIRTDNVTSPADQLEQPEVMYCTNHPQTETLIRCSKCLAPICPKCAVPTPVGLRCPQCARGAPNPLHQLAPYDYVVVLLIALVTSLLAGAFVTRLGLLFAIILGAPVGGMIAEAVLRGTHAVGGGRSKTGPAVQTITAVCIVIGAMVGPWLWQAARAGSLAVLPTNPFMYLLSIVNLGAIGYVVTAIGAAIARLR